MKLYSNVFKRKMVYYKDMPLFIYFVKHNVVFFRVSVVFRSSGRFSFLSSSISPAGFPHIKDIPYSVSFKCITDTICSSEINFFNDFLVNCTDRQLQTYYIQCCNLYLSSVFDDLFDCFNAFLISAIGECRFRTVLDGQYQRFCSLISSHSNSNDDLPF